MITLQTELVANGQKLTFDNDRSAGMIYVKYNGDGRLTYRFSPPFGPSISPVRSCLLSAQYDALAWAEDQHD